MSHCSPKNSFRGKWTLVETQVHIIPWEVQKENKRTACVRTGYRVHVDWPPAVSWDKTFTKAVIWNEDHPMWGGVLFDFRSLLFNISQVMMHTWRGYFEDDVLDCPDMWVVGASTRLGKLPNISRILLVNWGSQSIPRCMGTPKSEKSCWKWWVVSTGVVSDPQATTADPPTRKCFPAMLKQWADMNSKDF